MSLIPSYLAFTKRNRDISELKIRFILAKKVVAFLQFGDVYLLSPQPTSLFSCSARIHDRVALIDAKSISV
jgi:hypothetical protein